MLKVVTLRWTNTAINAGAITVQRKLDNGEYALLETLEPNAEQYIDIMELDDLPTFESVTYEVNTKAVVAGEERVGEPAELTLTQAELGDLDPLPEPELEPNEPAGGEISCDGALDWIAIDNRLSVNALYNVTINGQLANLGKFNDVGAVIGEALLELGMDPDIIRVDNVGLDNGADQQHIYNTTSEAVRMRIEPLTLDATPLSLLDGPAQSIGAENANPTLTIDPEWGIIEVCFAPAVPS